MSALRDQGQQMPAAVPDGTLPPRIRVLFITNCEHLGSNLAEALAADKTSQVILERAVGAAAGMARLRDELFEAVLLVHDEASLNALDILDAVRAGSSYRQPIVIIGRAAAEQLEPFCFEAGADSYVCLSTTTTRGLIWHVARAIERRRLIADNQRLSQARRHQLEADRNEAAQLLERQHRWISASGAAAASAPTLPPGAVVEHYRQLLQSSVVLGADNMVDEVARFSTVLSRAGVTAHQFIAVHLEAVDSMVNDLGKRGSRHVLNRAGLVAIEVLLRLCESYRLGLLDSLHV